MEGVKNQFSSFIEFVSFLVRRKHFHPDVARYVNGLLLPIPDEFSLHRMADLFHAYKK